MIRPAIDTARRPAAALRGPAKPALAVVMAVLALALPARASELPRRIGMYPTQGAPLAMLDSKLEVRVRGPIVEVVATQTFRNDTDRVTEATYVFPLPPDAAVSAMWIQSGKRFIRAEVARREDAQRRYEAAVAAGIGAALLDQERPDVFTQSVSAIPAHGSVSVMLRFDTTARFSTGTWELVLPMVVAPRYVPGSASGRPTTGAGRSPDTDRAPDASRITPSAAPGAGGKTEVTLEFEDPVEAVTSPTHEVGKRERSYAFTDPHSDHDAIVRWHAPSSAWVEQDRDGGYAAVLVEAPPAAARTRAVHCTLVVDRSATTRGDADAVGHPLVRALLDAMTPKDEVAISGSDRIEGRSPADTLRALDEVWTRNAGPLDLTRALRDLRPHGAVVLISDGLVADDHAAIAAARRVGVPIHVIGIGAAPNRSLLAAIANATGGTVRFATIGDDVAALARDVLSDVVTPPAPLAITWGTLAASDVVPAKLPRLGAGQATLVVARVQHAQQANARVRGDVLGFTMVTPPQMPDGAVTAHGAIARRWARLQLDELVAAGNPQAIADHAMRYGLASPVTSLVAVGHDIVIDGGVKHSVEVPVSVPSGMNWQAVQHETMVDTGTVVFESELGNGGKAQADTKSEAPAKHATKKGYREDADKNDEPLEDRKSKKPADDDEDVRPRHHNKRDPVSKAPAPTTPPPAAPRSETIDVTGTAENEPPDKGGRVGSNDEEAIDVDGTSEAVMITSERRLLRFSAGLGGGLAITHGQADVAAAVDGRIEYGSRTLVGAKGSLWLVGGLHLEGDVLATIARRGIARWLELGAGLGVHLGGGVGPAAELTLRTHLPRLPVEPFLRYDGALLNHDGIQDRRNTATFGVEASF